MKNVIKLILIAAAALAALAGAAVVFKKQAEKMTLIEDYDGEAMFIG
ncbi:MAG: hypothetical protein J1F63_02595 [Oscillospiraceae bacterium]|nr:hypothetical protein [Oscillospiraceae bacterium]